MKIGFDVDGVLADFNRSFIDRVVAVTGKDLFPARPFDIPLWNYPQHYGYSDKDLEYPHGPVWSSVVNDPTFWYMLYPYDGVPEFLAKLDSGVHDIYFMTNRPGLTSKAQTENWLEFHGFGASTQAFSYPTVMITIEKGACSKALNLDLYIDDKDENCLDVHYLSPKTRTVMLARPWNHAQQGIPRVESLDQFATFIEPF